jgi:hypothetical protein
VARPDIYDAFTRDVQGAILSASGTDSKGLACDCSGEAGLRPVEFMSGVVCINDRDAYVFPSDLSRKVFDGPPRVHGPYWSFWNIAFDLAQEARIAPSILDDRAMACVTLLQTAMERAFIDTQGWPETDPYGYGSAIRKLPVQHQGGLASLLLTRNLMLHRGAVALKRQRLDANESWSDATARGSGDADGPITSVVLAEFVACVFDALVHLQSHPMSIAPPERQRCKSTVASPT